MFKNLYINKKWYFTFLVIILLFIVSYVGDALFYVSCCLLIVFFIISFYDFYLLFYKSQPLKVKRHVNQTFHLGAYNKVDIHVLNNTFHHFFIKVIEEIPNIFQIRDFEINALLNPQGENVLSYQIKAIKRGEYNFGNTIVYIKTRISFLERRIIVLKEDVVKVYPSTKDFKKYQIIAQKNALVNQGEQVVRKVGNSMEFDQIREYVNGDDIRNINWKATARNNQFMINNYIDEKSKFVYNVIDTGRLMNYTFNDVTLLDYAINATLLLSKIILNKDDKVGLIAYNNKVNDVVIADKTPRQLYKINQVLYNLKTDFKDSSLETLLQFVSRKISHRSLLILFTNFESKISFERQLGYFKQLSKKHNVLVVFFENTQVKEMIHQPALTIDDIYKSIIAENYEFQKKQIAKELNNFGINCILTTPDKLNADVINKYLQLKKNYVV